MPPLSGTSKSTVLRDSGRRAVTYDRAAEERRSGTTGTAAAAAAAAVGAAAVSEPSSRHVSVMNLRRRDVAVACQWRAGDVSVTWQ